MASVLSGLVSKMGGQPWVRMRLVGIERITQTVLKFWKMCRECRKAWSRRTERTDG